MKSCGRQKLTKFVLVCHPAFRLKWFQDKLGADSYNQARVIFDHVFQQYKADFERASFVAPSSPSRESLKEPQSGTSESSYLEDIAMLDLSSGANDAQLPQNEFEMYCILHANKSGVDDPLKWWKVS